MCWHSSHKANYNRQGRNVRQVQKYIQRTKSLIQKVIKIAHKNNSVDNIKPIKEKFCEMKRFQNIKIAGVTFIKRLKYSIGYKIQKINTSVHYKKQKPRQIQYKILQRRK
jgi:hypothetical protein